MTISPEEIKKIAHLARLNLSEDDITLYAPQLSNILNLIEEMSKVDTTSVEPLAHSLDISQRLRPDTITEFNLREKFMQIAPKVEAGLYLVPKVIEEA
jgi:aspartyl-tRNA(Asn)/glutamyl-tRNA(Gln) amidotransferase subunit C